MLRSQDTGRVVKEWGVPPDSEATGVFSGEGTFIVRAEMKKGRQTSEGLERNISTEGKRRREQRRSVRAAELGHWSEVPCKKCLPKPHVVELLSPDMSLLRNVGPLRGRT